ncbi:Panacea domain-containing protein [Taklimakanibacter lacteus]|uniref:Panacea domain-containing protein n=1 Tax=Taklimakanibacter lacteus TaxID=2268456 RepID=UPI0013C41056
MGRSTKGAQMQFDKAKLKSVILYACTRCDGGELGAVKMHKVLYFLDMLHYADMGAPVTGSTYRKRDIGPTNDQLLPTLREMKAAGEIDVREVDYFGYRKVEYVARAQPRTELFSKRELDLLDEVIDFVCARNTAKTISEFSHNRAWEMVEFGAEIPYNSVLLILPTQVSPEAIEWGASQVGAIEAERSKGDAMGGTDFGAIRRRVLERHGAR